VTNPENMTHLSKLVKNDVDVNRHERLSTERLSTITLRI
jgi:hypothetical protein